MAHQRRQSRFYWLTAAILLFAVAGAAAWYRLRNASSDAPSDDTASLPRSVQFIISGDTAGWITPCGCTSNQSGGLLRRGTFVADARKKGEVVVLDAGGAAGGTSPYDLARFEAILRGERAMGIAGHNLGASEVAFGADSLRRIAKDLEAPFLSANVSVIDGDPVASPFRIVVAGGQKFAVIGVLSQRYKGPGLRIADPHDALLNAIRLAGEYDRLIVLAYLPEAELRQLAAALPEAEVIVGGPTGQSVPPTFLGERLLASATNKGKFLAHLESPPPGERRAWNGQIVELSASFADETTQKENVDQFYAFLAKREFLPHETSFLSRFSSEFSSDYRIAGSKACAECHSEAHTHWEKSKHAHAFATLEPRNAHVDAECQRCHTNGYGLPGGFLSHRRTPEFGGVGCESCHGPSQLHARNPSERTPFPAREQCLRCHDHENSPTFEFSNYWPKILHGKEGGEPKSPSEDRKSGSASPREIKL